MKHSVSQLAICGGPPAFPSKLPVGQLNLPAREDFITIFSKLFERRYYTNHGPLAQQLEEKLQQLFSVRNVVLMTNATIALSLACKALPFKKGDRIIVPAFTFAATVQALTWAGLEPIFCEVAPRSHLITPKTVEPLVLLPGVKGILGVHLWGNGCEVDELQQLATAHGLTVFYDAAHAVGCSHNGRPFGGFGTCEIFSFHATKIFNTAEGGCITTNNDNLAEKLRNLRSSYGRKKNIHIEISGNGRFSEAQAALGLLGLEKLTEYCTSNRKRMNAYMEGLHEIPGIRLLQPSPNEKHNCQYVVLEVDEKAFGLNRDQLVQVLETENILARRYFVPGMHRCPPYDTLFPQYADTLPLTDTLCKQVMQVPSGEIVTDDAIREICELIRFIHIHAREVRERL